MEIGFRELYGFTHLGRCSDRIREASSEKLSNWTLRIHLIGFWEPFGRNSTPIDGIQRTCRLEFGESLEQDFENPMNSIVRISWIGCRGWLDCDSENHSNGIQRISGKGFRKSFEWYSENPSTQTDFKIGNVKLLFYYSTNASESFNILDCNRLYRQTRPINIALIAYTP